FASNARSIFEDSIPVARFDLKSYRPAIALGKNLRRSRVGRGNGVTKTVLSICLGTNSPSDRAEFGKHVPSHAPQFKARIVAPTLNPP
ncbi:hypothetical protein, partial [Zarconia navalis]|uniref:hypothetical protein n=1 Tax=Zarconia navalis TaxID=2992134 RepID=UPI0021F86725